MKILFTNDFYKLERSLAVFMAEVKGYEVIKTFSKKNLPDVVCIGLKESAFRKRYSSEKIKNNEPTSKERKTLEAIENGANIKILRGVEEFVRFIVLDEFP